MQAMESTTTALRATFNEQGYVLARKLIPETIGNRVLDDLNLAAIQILRSRGALTPELEGGDLLDLLRAVFDLDMNLYLSILRLGSKLQSVYALTMHDNLIHILEELGCKSSVMPCGVAIHLVADELKIPGGYFGWGAHQDWASSQGSLDQLVLRMMRGAIDFDFKESKVLVDEESKPTDVVLRERSVAERLIEEFMLAANETVAEHFHWMEVPFIYRIHEDPKEDKLRRFFEFITNFGYIVKGTANDVHPRALQEIIEEVQGKPEEMVVSTVMLRSMQQAKYDPESLGHFGLSTEFYTHFTSPIRRYPDTIVHRLIRTYLIEGKLDSTTQEKWNARLPEIADHSSKMERRAVDAERETDELKKAEYMEDKIGEEYDGIISSVTNFGMFVELPNTIEGLVHVSYMTDDYYRFDERHFAMIGERTGNVFRIGDEITVRVVKVNKDERSIDFEIVGMKGTRRERVETPKVFKTGNDTKKPRRNKQQGGGRGQGGNGKSEGGNGQGNKAKKKRKFYDNVPKNKSTKRKNK